ncbi:MAG: hypothetical protein ABJD53_00865 [Gammaproteobacteria bacterium]
MTSISGRSPLVAAGPKRYANIFRVVPANLELLVAVVGTLGLIRDSLTDPAPVACVNLHSLFGILLWLSVIARFHHRLNQLLPMRPADIRAFARHLSRRVYLLLYGLMFLNLSLGVMQAAIHGAFVIRAEHFQCYLADGVFAVITIHALAALWLRLRGGLGNGRLTYREPASPKRQG